MSEPKKTPPLVKVLGYSLRVGTNNIVLTKDEIKELFFEMADILGVEYELETFDESNNNNSDLN